MIEIGSPTLHARGLAASLSPTRTSSPPSSPAPNPRREPALMLRAMIGVAREIGGRDAAHDRAGGGDRPLHQGLGLDHRHGLRPRPGRRGCARPAASRWPGGHRAADDEDMAVEAQDLGRQLGAEAVHDRHGDDQRRHRQHDGGEGDHARSAPRRRCCRLVQQVADRDRPLPGAERAGAGSRLARPQARRARLRAPRPSGRLRRLAGGAALQLHHAVASPRGPMISCQGRPIRSMVANLPPGRSSVSSSSGSLPAAVERGVGAARRPRRTAASPGRRLMMPTPNGATASGQMMPGLVVAGLDDRADAGARRRRRSCPSAPAARRRRARRRSRLHRRGCTCRRRRRSGRPRCRARLDALLLGRLALVAGLVVDVLGGGVEAGPLRRRSGVRSPS